MTSDIALYEGGQADVYRPQIMTPEAARELDEQLRLCTKAVLQEGADYGVIPGTGGEQVLFRPGAQKLLQWFQFSCTCVRSDIERDDEGRKHGITYVATVTKRLPDGTDMVLATCEGTADYDESKFYQSAEQVKERLRAQENKWAAKDGRRPNPERWMNATEYRADWNALMKRAQKRAIVGAVIDATAAGGIFKVEFDNHSSPAASTPPDGGPSWYQQALGEADALTSVDDGRELHRMAAQAVLGGTLTPDQATHVQNRIARRVRQLEAHVQASVEHLADNAAAEPADASPAQAAPPSPASATPLADAGEAQTRPPALIASGQKEQLDKERQRLGYGDSESDWDEWLGDVARLAGLAALATPGELTQAEAAPLIKRLKTLKDQAALRKLLATGEQDEAASGE